MLSTTANLLLVNMRACAEQEQTRPDGSRWGLVYLDNARPDDMSARAFAGYLSALKNAELYYSLNDDCFGLVRLNKKS
jgi:hypothetical protein